MKYKLFIIPFCFFNYSTLANNNLKIDEQNPIDMYTVTNSSENKVLYYLNQKKLGRLLNLANRV